MTCCVAHVAYNIYQFHRAHRVSVTLWCCRCRRCRRLISRSSLDSYTKSFSFTRAILFQTAHISLATDFLWLLVIVGIFFSFFRSLRSVVRSFVWMSSGCCCCCCVVIYFPICSCLFHMYVCLRCALHLTLNLIYWILAIFFPPHLFWFRDLYAFKFMKKYSNDVLRYTRQSVVIYIRDHESFRTVSD